MGRIDYGMPALLENGTLEANIATCKENGLDFIELNVNLPEYGVQALENTEYFRQAAEANGFQPDRRSGASGNRPPDDCLREENRYSAAEHAHGARRVHDAAGAQGADV